MKLGQVATMENNIGNQTDGQVQEQTNQLATDDLTEGEEGAQSAEMQTEVEQDASTLENEAVEVGRSLGAADKLDELQRATEDLAAGGPINGPASVMIATSLESILSHLDIQRKVIPTQEAFNGTFSKMKATKDTLESLGESARNLGVRIIASLKSLLSTVIGFIANFMKNRALMEKHLRVLMEKAEKIDNSAIQVNPTVDGRFTTALNVNGVTSNRTASAILRTGSSLVVCIEDSVKAIEKIRAGDSSVRPFSMIEDAIKTNIEPLFTSSKFTDSISGDPLQLYGFLVNNQSVAINANKPASQMTVSISTNLTKNVSLGDPAEALNKTQIMNLLGQAIHVIGQLRTVEKTTSRLGDLVKDILKRVEAAYAEVRGGFGSDDHAKKAKALSDARVAQEVIKRFFSRFPSLIFSAVKHVSDYARASMSNLKVS